MNGDQSEVNFTMCSFSLFSGKLEVRKIQEAEFFYPWTDKAFRNGYSFAVPKTENRFDHR